VLSEVRYARSGDVNIAYRVFGDGPFDVVFVPGTTSHVDFVMDVPGFRAILEQMASFSRLIFFDKRGTGLSDPVDAGTPLEVRMDDVRAVMDAAGSEHAAVMGISEGGPMSILFAATYPERAWALVLYGTYARELWAHDYPWGTPEAEYRSSLETMPTRVARPERFDEFARSGCPNGTAEELAALSRYLRLGGSLAAHVALARMNMAIDVRGSRRDSRADARVALRTRPVGLGRARPLPRGAGSGIDLRRGRLRHTHPSGGGSADDLRCSPAVLGARVGHARGRGSRTRACARDRPVHGHRRLE